MHIIIVLFYKRTSKMKYFTFLIMSNDFQLTLSNMKERRNKYM